MTGIAELHAQALGATRRIVGGVPADRWHAATPCADWDARALASHLVSGNLRAAGLAAGGTIEGAGSRLGGDLPGGDPAAAYDQSAAAAAAVSRRPGALDVISATRPSVRSLYSSATRSRTLARSSVSFSGTVPGGQPPGSPVRERGAARPGWPPTGRRSRPRECPATPARPVPGR